MRPFHMQAGSAMRSHESGPMITEAELLAPMGLASGAPPIPGKWRPTDGDSWPEGVVVPTLGAETTGAVGEGDDAGDADGAVAELNPGSGPPTGPAVVP
jgi:hypothetical protein